MTSAKVGIKLRAMDYIDIKQTASLMVMRKRISSGIGVPMW
ncbi:MAG TPA: hypothetical protein QF901_00215 [Gammaproteobacteria bacterium]|nr:hypothetical protein [Gammaproteobacteria bacterium]